MAQRVYADNSVLATGNWFKIGVTQEGIYKIDANMLAAMAIVSGPIRSTAIKIYGNGGAMLAERNALPRIDDLYENAMTVDDGGDGVFNGTDYLLFYAQGPNRWLKDSVNQRFTHQKNLYADTAFYFITISGTGKRIATKAVSGTPNTTVTSYQEHQFYENDLVNLLSSGREWYGENFNNNGIGTLSKTFNISWPSVLANQPLQLSTAVAARSVGLASNFNLQVNTQPALAIQMAQVSGYFLDAYAVESGIQGSYASIPLPASNSPQNLNIKYHFIPGNSGAEGWLNWFEVQGRCALNIDATKPLFFRDWASVSAGNLANFLIVNASSNSVIWELTDPLNPTQIVGNLVGGNLQFQNNATQLREYVVFDKTNLQTPISIGKIANQNLHHSTPADFLIILHPSLFNQAKRLADFHQQHDGYTAVIATTHQIYHEFSGGIPDPAAIRDFVKMYWDKANQNGSKKPRFLLLFGNGSYDPKNRIAANSNLVPAYETPNSLDPLISHVSDDFFGLLADASDINLVSPASLLDIGIGRIPAHNADDAAIMVNKIIHYSDTASLGAWRNQTVFIADDRDQNLHLNDAESLVSTVNNSNQNLNTNKIYLDAYPLISGNGGGTYPAVNDAIVNEVFNGNLIVNYSGHGNYQRLAEESILTQTETSRFNNPNKLPLFITASCDFAPYDDPSKNSLGSSLLMNNANGAIALMTTTRVVFAYSNRIMNNNYLRVALQPNSAGEWLTLGEAVQSAKNTTYQSFGDVYNNRKFTLLGDPAMRLAFPTYRLKLTAINSRPIAANDTLQALGKYELSGIVTDAHGNTINNFNGTIYPTVYDKAQQQKTLGNDPASIVTDFKVQNSVLYKGRATAKNGVFKFSFIVPKDINYQPGKARISLYGDNGLNDAGGADTSFAIAGLANTNSDTAGPIIKAYLNDENFKNGGLTNENPILLLHLSDSSGISTSGAAIGHDITAVIDGNERNVLLLNNYYSSLLDSYQEGTVSYQLPTQAAGKHQIRIKAWNVANHSSEVLLNFVVAKQEKLAVTKLMNYPNPFNSLTHFSFEHNQPNTDLQVAIAIFSEKGQIVKRITRTVNTGGTRNCIIDWNGTDENGRKLEKAIYIYRIKVNLHNSFYEEAKKLILF